MKKRKTRSKHHEYDNNTYFITVPSQIKSDLSMIHHNKVTTDGLLQWWRGYPDIKTASKRRSIQQIKL